MITQDPSTLTRGGILLIQKAQPYLGFFPFFLSKTKKT